MIFVDFLVGADNQPKLEIDRRKMQYKRYNHFYPNSTCKEHCDAKKGLVPYVQVNQSRHLLTHFTPINTNNRNHSY